MLLKLPSSPLVRLCGQQKDWARFAITNVHIVGNCLGLESLSDKTTLIVGLGAIGQEVAKFAKAFGMRVLGIRQSPTVVANVDQQGTLTDLPQMLPAADFLVLAVPLTAQTRGLIGATELARMKPTATLINVARGAVVDVQALKNALQTGTIRQACLDVLPTEPWPADDELWEVPNLFVTPHNAWSSPMYLPRVAELWLENLAALYAWGGIIASGSLNAPTHPPRPTRNFSPSSPTAHGQRSRCSGWW